MDDAKTLIEQAYAAFNRRDIEGALCLMTPDVAWPRASESGMITGKDEIRAYWARQWREFDPRVEPVAMSRDRNGDIRVTVRQIVKSTTGDLLADGEVVHLFTLSGGLIAAMRLGDVDAGTGPTTAFARRA